MKEAGCYRVAFGIESGSPEILKNINKHTTLEKIEKAVRLAQKARLITIGFFMVGNLGETDVTISQTISFIKKLNLDYVQSTVATPYPGTFLAEQVKQGGRIFAKEWSDYNLYKGSIFEWNDLPKDKIDGFQKRIYRECYFRPSYIIKRMFGIRSAYDLHFLWDGLKMLKNVIRLKPPDR